MGATSSTWKGEGMNGQLPTAHDIAMSALAVPDYSPLAELAKAAVMVTGIGWPSDTRIVAGVQLTAWQAKIAEAQFIALLAIPPQ